MATRGIRKPANKPLQGSEAAQTLLDRSPLPPLSGGSTATNPGSPHIFFVLLAGKFGHCLACLLHRRKSVGMDFDISYIISNHKEVRELCRSYRHRISNIHHSFLPSFAGAKPYHQADERGANIIGATCHFATENLDAGPIIGQDILDATATP